LLILIKDLQTRIKGQMSALAIPVMPALNPGRAEKMPMPYLKEPELNKIQGVCVTDTGMVLEILFMNLSFIIGFHVTESL
jgi:hypothetical protein